jgi:hypothetical protein
LVIDDLPRSFAGHLDDAIFVYFMKSRSGKTSPQFHYAVSSKIPKAQIKQSASLTPVVPLLRELGGFVRQSVLIPTQLFGFFIGEISWAARPGTSRYVRLDVELALVGRGDCLQT